MTRAYIEAVRSLGFGTCEDFAGPNPEGVGLRQATIHRGRRASTATAFLEPALARRNLALFKNSRVRRVLFEGRRAVGVEAALGDSTSAHIAAEREIILTSGAIHTPQLLLCSGVGDSSHLAEFGIATVAHLPGVGRNLHDHPASPVRVHTDSTDTYGLSASTCRAAFGSVRSMRSHARVRWQAMFSSRSLSSEPHRALTGPTSNSCSSQQILPLPAVGFHVATATGSAPCSCIRGVGAGFVSRARIRKLPR